MTDPGHPDEETQQATLTGELSGDLTGRIEGVVEITTEGSTPTPAPEETPVDDGRHEFTGESLELRSTIHTPAIRYSFTVGGVTDGESLEDADVYEEREDGRYHVMGTIGPKGSDTYYVHGKLDDWSTEHVETGDSVPQTKYDVAVAGETRELHKLLGEDAPRYDDTSAASIGGGERYSQKVTEEDADILVVDDPGAETLREALDAANSGDVVFVDGDAKIKSSGKAQRFHVPAGVTLASDRGIDGSNGALLHTDASYGWGGDGLVTAGKKARVTGLRVRGPHPDVRWRGHTGDYEMAGIRCVAAGVEIDNCEVFGWAMCTRTKNDAHIHHNHIHHANMEGLGYGVHAVSSEGAVIEFNHFEHWRHVVAGSGGGGYEARFNHIDGPSIGHAFDQHTPGGTYTDIHHNTSTVRGHDVKNKAAVFAAFRGDKTKNADVYKNWVQGNTKEPRRSSGGWTDEFIIRAQTTVITDVEWWDNHLGASNPPEGVGCPRDTGN